VNDRSIRGFRRRGGAWALAAAACGLLLSACGGSSTYSASNYSFDYPHSWKTVLAPASTPGQTGNVTRIGVGLDQTNLVVLATTGLQQPSGAQQIEQTEQSVMQALANSARQKGATVQGPGSVSLGSFQGLGLSITGLPLAGITVDSEVIVVVHGNTEYLLNCQSTQDKTEEIGKGCRQVIDSFTLS
jgi:hypothetical protein